MRIYLIRHSMTKGNKEKRYIGTTDESLCLEGIQLLEERKGMYGKIFKVLIKSLYNKSDKVVAVSKLIREDLVNNFNVDKDKVEFIKGLKQELGSKGIPVKTLKENAPVETLKAALHNDKENFFIPTSGNDLTLLRIIPQLTLLVRDNPEARIHLFGYPEWQTYTKDHLESFFELDTYFYSSFYTNNLLPAAINFTQAYRKWYSKEMEERYPKYGMLGFDTGYFFLKGLSKYGSELEKNLPQMDLTPIQTGFKFQRVNNWGGFVNKKVFFVHFTKNFELIKLDFE